MLNCTSLVGKHALKTSTYEIRNSLEMRKTFISGKKVLYNRLFMQLF
jgi:hypothetical protein